MIGFNALGQMGRLGNQMFQFASLKGIARNNGYEYAIPPTNVEEEWNDVDVYYRAVGEGKAQHQLFQPFKMGATISLNVQYIDPDRPVVQEGSFTFNEDLFNNCPDWVDIRGFFQTEKYFKHIRDELKRDFEFKDDQVIVFSDDPVWCHDSGLFADDRFLIAEGNSGYVDMCLMTMCKGHIIANSSFSWWGAWLADSKKVIAPSGWFTGSDNQHLDTIDIIPESWEVI